MEVENLLTFTNRSQLREWFERNHFSERCCWVACFGWIDSTLKKLPDGRLAQRLSPRRKGSHWTDLNLQRCLDLERRGLMTEYGRKALKDNLERRL